MRRNPLISRARRLSARALLPYLRGELPGWGYMLRGVGLLDDGYWRGAPTKQLRGKLHGYRMTLDLSNWSERQTYFLGRFYDLPTQLLVRAALRPGDTFIDVGGNVGMVTLLAARCVGETGRVHTFEPNPVAFARLSEHVRINSLGNVHLHNMGLGDEPGEFTLTVVGNHTGVGTLAPVVRANGKAWVTTHMALVARGDDALSDLPAVPLVMKIDVEGFECRVLKGFRNLLSGRRALVVTETVDVHLQRAGTSKAELFTVMQGYGYRPFALSTGRSGLNRRRLNLTPIVSAADSQAKNVAWLIPGGEHEHRLRDIITTD